MADADCASGVGGLVSCWGTNDSGELGDGTNTTHLSPVDVLLPMPAAHFISGSGHTCAVLMDAQVMCWGANTAGQLGDGTKTAHSLPTLVAFPQVHCQ